MTLLGLISTILTFYNSAAVSQPTYIYRAQQYVKRLLSSTFILYQQNWFRLQSTGSTNWAYNFKKQFVAEHAPTLKCTNHRNLHFMYICRCCINKYERYYGPGRRPLACLLYYRPTVSPACA